MYSVVGTAFLLCSNRVRLYKRLAEKQILFSVCSNFSTCSPQRKDKENMFFGVFSDVTPQKNSLEVGEELVGKLRKADVMKVINAFCRLPSVKTLSAENGLDEHLCQKAFFSFRKYCTETQCLPTDLHIILSDVIKNSANSIDIFPYFLRHCKEIFPQLECMEDLKKAGDIQQPANWYPLTRALKRKFFYHSGPTNSGKTYNALQSFYKAESGIYCGPLKLLAIEIYNKTNSKGIPCDLFTGEEIIYANKGDFSKHLACTIEMCPFDRTFDVAVIDEIQMLRDPIRGWAWTRALLGLRANEIHLCGEESALNIVDSILCSTNEMFEIKKYERLTELQICKPLKNLKDVAPGDCIVCFSKNDIFGVTTALEMLGHSPAIVYGSLPPQTKLNQCEKFNNPDDPCNVLVATDAVGMGLNLNIKRIIFHSLLKQSGTESAEGDNKKLISVSQALQIAGRAGRYGTEHTTGYVTTYKEKDIDDLKYLLSQRPSPIDRAGLLPTIDQLEMFSYYLPSCTFSELIDILLMACTVDNSLYFMCNLKDFKYLAQLIDHISLPIKSRFVFCCAPVNRKQNFACVMFIKFAKMYSLNQAVTVKYVCEKIGWPLKKPENLKELILLETIHEVLDIYLWLSNRFEEYFPDANIIKKIQMKIDDLTQEGVANLSRLYESDKEAESTEKSETEINSKFKVNTQ